MKRKPKKSAWLKTIAKKEIIEIESDTDTDDEVAATKLAPFGEENAKSSVKMEIKTESNIDEVCGKMMDLCVERNASKDDALAKKNPKKSAVAKTILNKEIIEIESDTDTDEVGPRKLPLCNEENASGDDVLAKNPKKCSVAKTIVKKEIKIESNIDELGGRLLVNASGDDVLAKKPKKSVVAKTIVWQEIIEIESATDTDTDEVGGKTLSLCGKVDASGDDLLARDGKTKRTNLQIVCVDDCDSGLVHDLEYKKYLAHFSETRNVYLLEDNVRGSSPVRIMYHEAPDRSLRKAVETEKSKAGRKPKSPTISSVSKRLKTEDGRADHKSISRTVLRTKETQQKKGDDVRRGRSSIEVKPRSYVRDTKERNGDARRGRKISVAKNTIESKPTRYVRDSQEKNTRNDESQTIFRASKRLKTEIGRADHNSISKTNPVVKTKDIQRKNREALRGRKIHVTKHNNESKSRGHVIDNLFHSFKPSKKENEMSLSSVEKSYSYYTAFLRNSIRNSVTIFNSGQQVKPMKDAVCLSDPDIIAVSNHPFPDGGKSPFEATKDGKVIDLEDGIKPDDIFNSSFSKKLMEILRNPYDEKEFLRLYNEASVKRPLTKSRQLRDGREIEYYCDDQFALSYLEKYTDFNKTYHRYRKDLPRALNLLRGFFFYLENIVLEGAFKPWLHEKRLTNLCVDTRGCIDIVGNK
ncbi:hypothetical protein ISN44_As01g066950 [Arabidopsis suecica]|uniref:Uncharacterized protein n=1 Tax=Arabidopsis suecica TaxID=45249 RepID=A0A8T2HKQ0_ARASU|nr:hypothetical protein ISN44_As01g066950 [Arabidopsis suecica]